MVESTMADFFYCCSPIRMLPLQRKARQGAQLERWTGHGKHSCNLKPNELHFT